MNRGARTMGKGLDVSGVHILDAYLEYTSGMYIVNRRYQRKLVWEIEEKQNFIDTLFHDYPVPIFILADYKRDGKDWHEIIDGLQRLDAIFSFIDGKFPVMWDGVEGYFNLDALAGGANDVRTGKREQKEPYHSFAVCRAFLNYLLPISTTQVSDTEVEDIFRRINSTGRKLSKQDLRQSGAIGHFSDLVRKTASYIRNDYTDGDHIDLKEMPSLSYSNSHLHYGVSVRNSFWYSQGVLTEKNIRNSADEELIAKLYAYIVLGEKATPSSSALDSFYREGSKYNTSLANRIGQVGIGKYMNDFTDIIEQINSIFNSVRSTYSEWLFANQRKSGKGKVFQALFLALYNLKQESYVIEDYIAAAKTLQHIGDKKFREITDDGDWNTALRNKAIAVFYNKIQPVAVRKVASKELLEARKEIEAILNKASGLEQQMFDMKLGISYLENGKLNEECVEKIIRTLTAMANTQPGKLGHVIIGIADNKKAADTHKKHYGSNYSCYGNFFITGIDSEATKYRGGLDRYSQTLERAIEKAPTASEFIDYVLKNYHVVSYDNHTLVVLPCMSSSAPVPYNKEYFVRYGSNLQEVEPGTPQFDEMMKAFYSGKLNQEGALCRVGHPPLLPFNLLKPNKPQ